MLYIQAYLCSIPLNTRRRFCRHIIQHAVDAGHFIDNAGADAGEGVVGDARPVGGHEIVGDDGAQGDGGGVGALVACEADGAHIGQHGEILADGAVQAG